MLFNPLKLWLTKGPFNKLFVDYIFNKHIKWYQKVSAPGPAATDICIATVTAVTAHKAGS
jgi:hypothetical protein